MSIYRDPEMICAYLIKWIREKLLAANAEGAVLGISGGIDSAVLAALLARALRPENVIGVIMPCHSQPIDEEYARMLARVTEIRVLKVELTGTFESLLSAIGSNGLDLGAPAASNIKPRLRMAALYSIAQEHHYLVFGASNRDELMYGYFTKYGDSGVDLLPMADLLKGEVRAVAACLGVPREIIDRPPTAALWDGQTDEAEMGLTYDQLDTYLATGSAPEMLKDKIEKAVTKSEHKRNFAPMAVLPDDI